MPSRPKRRRPFAAFAAAALLLAAQVATVAHLHDGGAPESVCVVCSLAKAQTAAVGHPPLAGEPAAGYPVPATAHVPGGFPATLPARRPRGPPHT